MKAIVLAVAVVALVPLEAVAACAWVVWIQITDAPKSGSPRSAGWEIMQAVERQDLCEQIIRAKTKDQPRDLAGFNMAKLKDDKDGTSYIRYLCVPDTIDPRGPTDAAR
jgi:hypothetical protein